MGSVHYNRVTEFAHNGKPAHIRHQSVIAEACAALCKHNVVVAGFFNFFDNVFHIPRGKELAFFHINGSAGFCSLVNKVSLAAQKCRNLQNIGNFRHGFCLRRFVNIRYNGYTQIFFYLSQNGQTFF